MPRKQLAAFDLKAARKMRGLSQEAVAKILETSQPSVARWEADGSMPAIYRKAWDQHWKLEAQDDTGSTRRISKPRTSGRKTKGSAAGASSSTAGSRSSVTEGQSESA